MKTIPFFARSPFESSMFVPFFDSQSNYENTSSLLNWLALNNNLSFVFLLTVVIPFFVVYYTSSTIINDFFLRKILFPAYEFCYRLNCTYVPSLKYFTFPFTFCLFISLISVNLLGMVPFGFAVTSHLSYTFMLAFTVWFSVVTLNFYFTGASFLTHFLIKGIPSVLVPFLLLVELLSYFIRVVSLSLRLFANIFSGHILTHVISGALFQFFFSLLNGWTLTSTIVYFLGTILFCILVIFELMMSFLQAYIFVLLSLIYLSEVDSGH